MSNIATVAAIGNIGQGNVTAETAFPTVTGGTVRAIVGPPPSAPGTSLEGRLLRLRCAAKVTTGASLTYTLKLYWSNSVNADLTTFAGDIGICTSGAITIATVTRMILLQSDIIWDSTSQRLNGCFSI